MNRDRRARAWNVVGFFSSLFFVATSFAAGTRITVSRAALHEAPAAGSRVIAVVPAGAQLPIGSCSQVWCRTSWGGAEGWVAKSDLGTRKSGRKDYYINSDGFHSWLPRFRC